jgi:uncharacterized membrane protein YfcA
LEFTVLEVALALGVVTLGASVQATLGFGMALIAAPLLLLIEPQFVPGPLMAASLCLTGLVAHRDRAHIDIAGMKSATLGRVLGTLIAMTFLSVASAQSFDLVFGVLVVFGVLLTVFHPALRPTRLTTGLAGVASGLMGTISSIGGPPMALVYHDAGAARLRGTLAGFFLFGTVISVAGLAIVGRYGWYEIQLSLILCPGMIVGFFVGLSLRRWVSDRAIRPMVLGLSLLAAAVVLFRVAI